MSAFAWPVTVLIFAALFVFLFRKEISRFIDRTQRVSREGVEAGTTAIATQEVKDIARPSPADDVLRGFDNQMLVEQEGLIRAYLEQNKIQNPAERERVLIRYLASSYIVQRFESLYHSIWGSQLRALHLLNESEPQGIPLQALEPWYELGKTLEPEWYADYSFEQWYGFMEVMFLVINQTGSVHITVGGNEFLKYIIQRTYSMSKRG